MEATLDTVVVCSLLRRPRRGRAAAARGTSLDCFVQARRLLIGVDPGLSIVSEWKQTAGEEPVQAMLTKWDEYGGFFRVQKLGRIPPHVAKQLRILGFVDAIDKLLIRTALALADKIVVSTESDFWHPSRPNDKALRGNSNAPVARCCRQRLDVTVLTLRQLIDLM